MTRMICEVIFSFLEMLISLYFADGLFRKKRMENKTIPVWILFSSFGAVFLVLKVYVLTWLPDFAPAVLIFTLYVAIVCRTKWYFAIPWALANYLFIGIISVSIVYVWTLCLSAAMERERSAELIWVLGCILTRIGQFLLSEIILCVWKKFPVSSVVHRGNWKVMIISSISIVLVGILYGREASLTNLNEETLYQDSLICLLVLAVNLAFLLFDAIIAREKYVEEELKTQNQLVMMRVRNQDEVNNMYRSILSLKHDINNHLHTIAGYMQVGEYKKAQEYVGEIAGEVSKIKSFHSGNTVVDSLIGSKTALAEMNGITVNVDMTVPPALQIADTDLTVMIGNLYDNAIEANLKIPDEGKRFINIKILFDGGNLLFLFENAAPEEERSGQRGVWRTSKKDSSMHGIGLQNIDRIVQMYGGYLEREQKEQVFCCRIRMPGK